MNLSTYVIKYLLLCRVRGNIYDCGTTKSCKQILTGDFILGNREACQWCTGAFSGEFMNYNPKQVNKQVHITQQQ